MKLSEIKSIVKEAVRDAIKEELKDIIIEVLKSNNSPLNENNNSQVQNFMPYSPPKEIKSINPAFDRDKLRGLYENNLKGDTLSFNTTNLPNNMGFNNIDPMNGSLPNGELDFNTISNLMSGKI